MTTESNVSFGQYLPSTLFFDPYEEQSGPFYVYNKYNRYVHNFNQSWDETDAIRWGINIGLSTYAQREKRPVLANSSSKMDWHFSEEDLIDATIEDISHILHSWGERKIARRISYFASDEDLEDDDIPLTPESARGFFLFFGLVKSDGDISLTCSPEGRLCVSWKFSDKREASLWFLDEKHIMFAATNYNGDFIELSNGNETGESWEVMLKLIQAGLLTWNLDARSRTSLTYTTSLGNAEKEIWREMGRQVQTHFFLGNRTTNHIFQQTGWNTSIPVTATLRLVA